MDNKQIVNYVKRTQRDYTLTLKLEIVREVESGELSVTGVKREIWNTTSELEQKVKLLEKQKALLEKRADYAD